MASALRLRLLKGVRSGWGASIILEKRHAGLEGLCKRRQNKRVMGRIGGPGFDRESQLISLSAEGEVGDNELTSP